MKAGRLALRAVGLLLLGYGGYLMYRGTAAFPVVYKDITIPVPYDVILAAIGVLLAVQPTLLLNIAAAFLPERKAAGLQKVIDSLEGAEPLLIKDTDSPETVATRFNRYVQHDTRRYYLTIALLVILLSVLMPLVVARVNAQRAYDQYGRSLAALVQQVRLEFGSADEFRSVLRQSSPVLDPRAKDSTATVRLSALLGDLYGPGVSSPGQFESALEEMYQECVASRAVNKLGLAPSVPGVSMRGAQDPAYQRIALYTLLALSANPQGDEGAFVVPYLQARQLLNAADALRPGTDQSLSGTTNALGVAYVGLLKGYGQYDSLMRELSDEEKQMARTALGESVPLTKLELAQRASSAYMGAAQLAASNYARARYLNNYIDLEITLIRWVHLEGQDLIGQSKDAGTANQLRLDLGALALQAGSNATAAIVPILRRHAAALDTAITLSRQPLIMMTSAELYALAGRLAERYKLRDPVWGNVAQLRHDGIERVATAVAMHVPSHRLDEQRLRRDGLVWLFSTREGRQRLDALRRASQGGAID
jgi:hypothetical protein